MTIKVIVIDPYDGLTMTHKPWRELEINGSLESYQKLVGGMIDFLPVGPQDGYYLHDEGKFEGLPVNGVATFLANANQALLPGDYIAGPVVVVGPPDDDGNTTEARLDVWLRMLNAIWDAHQDNSVQSLNAPLLNE